MQTVTAATLISWPEATVNKSLTFTTLYADGVFTFTFKWLNGRWNCWVTLPSGDIREAGVYPNVVSWSEYDDFGILFATDLSVIDQSSLTLTEMYLLTWQ